MNTPAFNFDATYRHNGWLKGAALNAIGYATERRPMIFYVEDEEGNEHEEEDWSETEEVEDTDRIRVVMVGDDHVHTVDRDELEELPEEGYCPGCGQIGCGHYR